MLRLAIRQAHSSHSVRSNPFIANRQRRHTSHNHEYTEDHDDDNDDDEPNDHEQDFLSQAKITPTMFLDMCPALLVQLDQRSCSSVSAQPIQKSGVFGIGIN